MQIELANPPTVRKHHEPTPVDLEPMLEMYADSTLPIDPRDLNLLLERYATDQRVDLYTLCDVLNISRSTLRKLLSSEEFKQLYSEARARRGEMLASLGLEVAGTPYYKLVNGEECSKELVNASKNFSNYLLLYARSMSADLAPQKAAERDNGAVNIQINLPQMANLGGSSE